MKNVSFEISFERHSNQLEVATQVTGIMTALPFEYQYFYLVLYL